MNSPRALRVTFSEDMLTVDLDDGRILSVPLEWFPRLRDATEEDLRDFRLIGNGHGIHWERLDEDLSVHGLLRPIHFEDH